LERRALLPWLVSAAVGGLLALPAMLLISSQSGQVDWIPALDRQLPRAIAEYQWFVGAPLFAGAAAVVVLAAVVVRRAAFAADLVAVAVPWAVVPTVLLIGYSAVARPIYLDRYLTFTAPAAALLIGAAVAALATNRRLAPLPTAALLLATLVATAAPAYIAQRGQWSKPSEMDFSDVAAFMAVHGQPGDCVLFTNHSAWNPTSARVAMNIRPAAFDGLRDVGLGRSAVPEGWLWDENLPLTAVADRLVGCDVVWFVADADRDHARTIRHTSNEVWTLEPYHFDSSVDYRELAVAGLRIEQRWQLHMSQVVLLRR